MKTNLLKSVLIIFTTLALLSFDIPAGWFTAGSKPQSYEMGIDKGAGQSGKNAATIKSKDASIDGFGTLMQQFNPGQYLGKRVRMSGYVKSVNVTNWAGLWFRVDQAGSKQSLSFDNMEKRAIKGTTGWKKYEIVLDVPNHASLIAFGALLAGTGQIWFDNIKFEIVDNSVPTTDMIATAVKDASAASAPANLDFEK
ncbi:MAG: hypothetical protein ACM3O8_00670 [Methylococcaceae bacterium]|nr:hypothetical protein [Prolixibacteraceae bacterium]